MTLALFGNILKPSILTTVQEIFLFFQQNNVQLLLSKTIHDYVVEQGICPEISYHVLENDNFNADLAVSIGGDGTFLNTAALVGAKSIPIIGINTGRLGFLADISGQELSNALKAILENRLNITEHTTLKVTFPDQYSVDYPYVLNDVSILKQDSSSMVSINTHLNGEAIHTYHADGLVISTPTGSTAYSMSVGGPIMVPQSNCIILSPVASHSLTVRPLVIPDDWTIELEVLSRSGSFQVSLDGRSMVMEEGAKIKIALGNYKIKVAKQQHHTFFDSLKSKLMWGLDKRN